MTARMPVSVVVPVFNAARTLAACVESILRQDYPVEAYEAVFVDNGSTDGSLDILRSFEPDIRVLREDTKGPSAARNAGIRAVRHDVIAFTDSDCVARPDWLGALIDTVSVHPGAALIGGLILAHEPRVPVERFAECLFDQRSAVNQNRLPYVISANLCARKAVLESAGMFDETLRTGEDVDLSYRVAALPGEFVLAERAVVEHANPASLWALARKAMEHGRTAGNLADRHHALRGVTAEERFLDGRRYLRIVRQLGAFSVAASRRLVGSDEDDRGEWLRPLYDAVTTGAKQVGVASHILSRSRKET